ncbi:nuclease-related domain-containing protein [Flavobacterium sp. 28YEA47A]|uniref:nuclease-related domain-containing protein n=1 Tax=Flavobacterium sp. 28YEA47A TaxID=3156276 RepID=UPI0035114C23
MEILIVVFFIIVFFIAFIRKSSNTFEIRSEPKRGTRAERNLVSILKHSGIPEQTIFHDLYVKKYNGNFSQIDLVVATKAGIIVFEVKDYSGWIFGTGYQSQWTQVLAYGQRKYRFYNPILQNNKHISDLRKTLRQFENIPFYSIIVFYGDCELKDINFVPKGTFLVKPERVIEAMRIIIANNEPACYTDKHEVVRALQEAVQNGESPEVQWQHIENLRDMLGKDRVFE